MQIELFESILCGGMRRSTDDKCSSHFVQAAQTESTSQLKSMWQQFQQFLSLIRFSHTLFALPFALLSAVLAWRTTEFRWQDLMGVLLCMVFARSAAMAFNRLVDHKVDADNPRTAGRHIPAGLLSVKAVTFFTLLSSLGFIASTLIFLPKTWPIILSVPVLLFLLGYSYAKRFTSLCHYWLSAALMMSPIAAWLAITDGLAVTPFLLAAVIFFWVGGFDIIYACQDSDYDRQVGTPIDSRSLRQQIGVTNCVHEPFDHHRLSVCLMAFRQSGLGLSERDQSRLFATSLRTFGCPRRRPQPRSIWPSFASMP